MSTKPKKKTVKTKKIKRAPLKQSYTEEEKLELKNRYDDILFHLSNFLSEHSVYEAVPENVKILVFSSELNFYEMIKVFIFEDIYCGLIYNPNLNNYLGLITTRDLMLLYKYIIDNFSGEKIENFDLYLKNIFSINKKYITKKEDEIDINNNLNINNNQNSNINIFNHLKNINYLDYLIYVKNKELHNINIFSVSLDDNLFETLKKINIKNIHRLLVEDDVKNELRNEQQLKEEQKENEQITLKRKEALQKKRVISNAEKTTSANDSDEENKNIPKIDMKKILETNKEDIIIEKCENTLTKDDIEISKEKINNEEENNNKNNIAIKQNILDEKINENDIDDKLENLKINEIEEKTVKEKPKKKKIIKKEKIKSQTIKEKEKASTQIETPKKRGSKQFDIGAKEICDEIIKVIETEENGKKIIKKIKKKIIKKKKEVKLELPSENENKNETTENTHKKMNTNITEFINEEKLNQDMNIKAVTEENQPKTEKKKKIKKKIVKKKSKQISQKLEDKLNNVLDYNKDEIKDENKNQLNINDNSEENKILKNLEEKINIDSDNDNENKNNKKEKKERKESEKSLENIRFEDKMKNYVGIVTNETIFEYLTFNYYSNDMKEFNLSLNELIILGENTFLVPLANIKDAKEKVYNTFNYYLDGNFDIIPIFSDKEIEGFIYPKDFLFYIYNCESEQNLTNKEFLEYLYKDIDDEKPYGKNRVVYLEINDNTKTFYVKELIEKLNCSIEKKIVLIDPNNNNKLFLISLKTIFKAIVEFNLNK